MAAVTQTITIVDKSNKVISASKQLKGVFSEAKQAYLARKAEIKAERQRKEEVELRKAIKACSIAEDEARSQVSGTSRSRHESTRRRRSEYEGTHTHRSGSNTPPSPALPDRQISLGQFNEQLYGQARSTPRSPDSASPYPSQALQRRQTDQGFPISRPESTIPRPLVRSNTSPDIDLDLAYGEFYESDQSPSDRELQVRAAPNGLVVKNQEKELSSLVLKCKMLLEEADCAGQSVKAIITHLQANPEAMAAVALTLAEISNIAAKVAPGALTALKGSAPAVMALLAAPEFLVAVGVGIGVTVVMFGGYKIIKKIKAASESSNSEATPKQVDLAQGGELLDVKELDRIEKWRRGIADGGHDNETGSVISGHSQATSVEGEFITPFAAQSMGHLPLPKDKSKKSSSSKKDKDGKEKRKRRHRKPEDSDRDGTVSEGAGSERSSSSSRRVEGQELVKIKKPSPLRKMFTMNGASSSTGWEALSRK